MEFLEGTVRRRPRPRVACPTAPPGIAAPQPSSTLLSRLPPEIRNEIWDLSFSGTNREVDLLHDACPPSSNLLLTCRQMHAEAKGFWPGRREKYWRSTRFFIEFDPSAMLNAEISFPADEDLDEIRHIILQPDGDETTQTQLPVSIVYDVFDDQVVVKYETGGPPARYRSFAIIEQLELRALLGMEVPDV
ncbi:hypothetical protein B0A54_09655 [Friedmanniomyces endolithicus]|uniref:F-box domain-containing protein n=1 Tax=Friedmanniomyces endolithicus TaxID=329885 RepID=A0A4U0USS9_9PEZI|nr:hypothetical protein B0A54_09655 [Friedmanniomyces endolithicus]